MSHWLGKILARQAIGGGGGATGIADQGNIWYASPSGSGSQFTFANPGSLPNILSSGTTPASPGDTIKLRGGTYTGLFTSSIAGTVSSGIDNPAGKIIVKPYQDERPILDPGTNLASNTLTITGAYVWYVGLEALISNFTGRGPSSSDDATAITSGGSGVQGVKLIGCTAHDTTGGSFSPFNQWTNSEMNGCLGYYSGESQNAGPNYAYPLYSQNSSGTKRVYKCAFVFGFGNYPIHCFTGTPGNMVGMDFQYNATIGGKGGAGSWVLFWPNDVQSVTHNHNNYYAAGGSTDGVLDLGGVAFGPGTINAVVQDNYLRGKVAMNSTRTGMDFSSNNQYGDQDNFTQGEFPANNYFASSPGANWVRVTAYDYIRKAGMVSIFNFTGSTSLAVDLSPILSVNDPYEVIDMQNRFGSALVTGTYAGGTVSLPLDSTAVATAAQVPTGRSQPTHTSTEFNCFLVRATPYLW